MYFLYLLLLCRNLHSPSWLAKTGRPRGILAWALVLCYPKIQYIKSKHHSLTDRCTSKITVRTDLKFGIEVLLIFSPCNKKKFSKMLRFGGVINNYNWYLCVIAPTADPSRLHWFHLCVLWRLLLSSLSLCVDVFLTSK